MNKLIQYILFVILLIIEVGAIENLTLHTHLAFVILAFLVAIPNNYLLIKIWDNQLNSNTGRAG